MPEKTIHGYNYKVRIWYPNAPENSTEGMILAAYEEDLAKEIQLQYPGVTYEIISKEPVLGMPVNPGPDELQFKAPLARAEQFMNELRGMGFDVGHDADYEDPVNYMTVIVRDVPPGRKRLLLDTAERYAALLKQGNPGEKPSRLELIRRIKPILPSAQLDLSGVLLRDEEGEHFEKVFLKLAQTFEAMPRPYQTEGTPTNDKIIHLHYFTSGSDWYIIERDSGQEQIQAFGYVILNQDLQNAEWGYVNIEEMKGYPQVELDFHWTPKTFKEVMIVKNPRAIESDNLEPIPEYVKTDPKLLGNAIMHIANAELTKIGVTSGGELKQRGLFSEYESNFITALQKVGIPKPLLQQVEEILTSLNYHTANEILTKNGYYPWQNPGMHGERAQQAWRKRASGIQGCEICGTCGGPLSYSESTEEWYCPKCAFGQAAKIGNPAVDQNLRDRLITEIFNNRMNAWKQGHVGVKPVSDDDLTQLRSMTAQELEQTAKLTRQFSFPVVGQTQEKIQYRWEFLPVGQGHYITPGGFFEAFYTALEEATRDVVILQQWKPRENWKYALLPPTMKGWTPEQVIDYYVGTGRDRKIITEVMEGASLYHQGP